MKRLTAAVALAAALGLTAAAIAQTPARPPSTNLAAPKLVGPPKELLPEQVGGVVVYVRDLEAQKLWYETMLGFRAVNSYSRDGKVFADIPQMDHQSAPAGVQARPLSRH